MTTELNFNASEIGQLIPALEISESVEIGDYGMFDNGNWLYGVSPESHFEASLTTADSMADFHYQRRKESQIERNPQNERYHTIKGDSSAKWFLHLCDVRDFLQWQKGDSRWMIIMGNEASHAMYDSIVNTAHSFGLVVTATYEAWNTFHNS